jgi:hypothetical protein
MVLIDERTYLRFVLSCCPVGMMEGEQFISLHSVPFPRLIRGVQCVTALEFSRLTNKNIEGIPIYAADGEDLATSVGSVN